MAAQTRLVIPKEARDGLLRAWCAILEKKTGLKWVPVEPKPEKKK